MTIRQLNWQQASSAMLVIFIAGGGWWQLLAQATEIQEAETKIVSMQERQAKLDKDLAVIETQREGLAKQLDEFKSITNKNFDNLDRKLDTLLRLQNVRN